MVAEVYTVRPKSGDILTAIHALASEAGEKSLCVASAESCTGGGIGRLLSSVAGSSRWYAGGVISYSDHVKHKLLNVSTYDLQKFGAVSEAVVKQMAAGVLTATDADIGVAVSGIAGPNGGSINTPVGTVWLAWAMTCGTVTAEVFHFAGDREAVRSQAEYRAISGLLNLARAYTANPCRNN